MAGKQDPPWAARSWERPHSALRLLTESCSHEIPRHKAEGPRVELGSRHLALCLSPSVCLSLLPTFRIFHCGSLGSPPPHSSSANSQLCLAQLLPDGSELRAPELSVAPCRCRALGASPQAFGVVWSGLPSVHQPGLRVHQRWQSLWRRVLTPPAVSQNCFPFAFGGARGGVTGECALAPSAACEGLEKLRSAARALGQG